MGEQPRDPALKDWAWTDQKAQMLAVALCVLPIVLPGAPPIVRCIGAAGAFGTLAWLAMEVPRWTRVRSKMWKTTFYAVAAVGILILVASMYYVLTAPAGSSDTWKREPQDYSRNFVSVTPRFLASLYRGHTKAEGDKLLDLYRGRWMHVSGTVKNADDFEFGGKHVTLQIGPGGFLDRVFGALTDTNVLAYFDSKWDDQIAALHAGDRITIVGNIDAMSDDGPVLQTCELRTPE